jgi:hypothetical protein
MILKDIRDAVNDAVGSKVTATVTSAGVPSGQTAFNPGETVTYSVKITNAADGGQLNNVRVHVYVSDASKIKLIVPPTTIATAYQSASGTSVWNPGTEQIAMFLYTSTLSVLSPGDVETIPNLTVKGLAVGTPVIYAHIHCAVDMNWLFPPDNTGVNGSKTFNIVT